MNWIELIVKNVILTLALLFLLFISPPIVLDIYKFSTGTLGNENVSDVASLHIYDEFSWSQTHFREMGQLQTEYHDYITWRRRDFHGETININNGFRKTLAPTLVESGREFWFFGGSTTWGTGVNDENTYPSLFAQKYKTTVKNYGEAAYTARQSLALLQNLAIDPSRQRATTKSTIVFYDGVNDVLHRCRSEITGLGSGREAQLREIVKNNGEAQKYTYSRTFAQLFDMTRDVAQYLPLAPSSPSEQTASYICDLDKSRAKYIARSLVATWEQADVIAKSLGHEFHAILQPVAFVGEPVTDYLKLNNTDSLALKEQYEAVYPLIRKYARNANISFIDLTNVYDGCNDCYVDFCHVGPQAHLRLINQLDFF